MAIYPFRCRACGFLLEFRFAPSSVPAEVVCPQCEGSMVQDYAAKGVLVTPLREVDREENRLTEADRPTAAALAALRAFGEKPVYARRESGLRVDVSSIRIGGGEG